jgi:hypothetical protein
MQNNVLGIAPNRLLNLANPAPPPAIAPNRLLGIRPLSPSTLSAALDAGLDRSIETNRLLRKPGE